MNNLLDEFSEIWDECAVMAFLTRDFDLQREACDRLEGLILASINFKGKAISEHDENLANFFLACECASMALRYEICMWMYLRRENPDGAWNCLVAAQSYSELAVKSHDVFLHFAGYCQKLADTERVVFPPQVFMSAGFIAEQQICSICGDDYDDCSHVAGRPYMGQICVIKPTGIQLDHTAIVSDPADKRCRIVDFRVEGGVRNRMTWKAEGCADNDGNEGDPSSGLTATAILAVASKEGELHLPRPWRSDSTSI